MIPHPEDTIVALSSAPGPGRRAIVRISGPKTQAVIATVFTPALSAASGESQGEGSEPLPAPPDPSSAARLPQTQQREQPRGRRLVPGAVRLSGVTSPLPADLYFFAGPRSYTGQDVAELHTISSPPLVERLIADILAAGARSAQPGEFTLRAFLAGKLDLTRAEAVLAVIEAGTDADLKSALTQLAGGLAHPLDNLRNDLLNLLADVEAGLDFVDEDIEFVAPKDMLLRIGAGIAQLTNLKRQLESRTVSGRPVRVVLVGKPNAGKSSLFNALAGGPQALVSPVAGTTRDYLTRTIDLGGVAVELIDTAGWAEATGTIEEQSQRLGRQQAGQADVLLWCVPVDEPADESDRPSGTEVILVRTKSDTRPQTADSSAGDFVASSIVTPGGIDRLRALLTERVQTLARPPLAPSQSRCRHHVDEAIQSLRRAHAHVLYEDPQELLALALRETLDQVGQMVGAVYTNDLLDRIFSRFCIGK
jgi:tRNA modification GTPase